MSRPSQGAVLLLVCLSSGAWATDPTLDLTTTGSGSVMGGVYTSPYGITVNGVSSLLICDDFTTDISLGQTWTASVNTLTQLSGNPGNPVTNDALKFPSAAYPDPPNTGILGGGTGPLSQPTDNQAAAYDYAVAAVIAAEIEQIPNIGTAQESSANDILSGELSYAMWSIFDLSLYNSLNANGATGFGALSMQEVQAVDADLTAAENLVIGATTGGQPVVSSSFTSAFTGQKVTNSLILGGTTNLSSITVGGQTLDNMTVYTPQPVTQSQEFIVVSMAEPSYPVVLAFDLLAVLVLMITFRRRISGILN